MCRRSCETWDRFGEEAAAGTERLGGFVFQCDCAHGISCSATSIIAAGRPALSAGPGVATMLLTLMFFFAIAAIVLIAFGTFGDVWDEWRHPDHRFANDESHSLKTRQR